MHVLRGSSAFRGDGAHLRPVPAQHPCHRWLSRAAEAFFFSSRRRFLLPRPRQGTKGHKYSHKTARDAKFNLPHADVLYDALQKELAGQPPKPREVNEDLPGLGQFYCNVSGRAPRRRPLPPRRAGRRLMV